MGWKWIVVIVLIVIAATTLYMMLPKSTSLPEDYECIEDENCELSLCDCKCYPTGETPEAKEGILCGKNCEEWYNVSGCECKNYECEEIKVK